MSSLAELEVADAAAYTFSQVRAGDLVVRLNNSNSPGFHAGYTTPTPATLISATSSNIELGTGSNMATLSNNAFIVGASGTGQVSANNLGLFRNRIING
ncbi:hypothetical protein EBT25_11810, partial [bacterium]|nr:hypothetical protein [bacterium]